MLLAIVAVLVAVTHTPSALVRHCMGQSGHVGCVAANTRTLFVLFLGTKYCNDVLSRTFGREEHGTIASSILSCAAEWCARERLPSPRIMVPFSHDTEGRFLGGMG